MDEHISDWKLKVQKENPDLWQFFDGVESYEHDKKEDLNCRRWKHIMDIVHLISISTTEEIICKPGEITIRYNEPCQENYDGCVENCDHNQECMHFYLNRVTIIDKNTYVYYMKWDCKDSDRIWTKSLSFAFTNIFNLNSTIDFFESYALVPTFRHSLMHRHQIAVAAQLKGLDGYFYFEFNS